MGFIMDTSLVTIRMLGDVLIDIYKIPELRNRIFWTLGLPLGWEPACAGDPATGKPIL